MRKLKKKTVTEKVTVTTLSCDMCGQKLEDVYGISSSWFPHISVPYDRIDYPKIEKKNIDLCYKCFDKHIYPVLLDKVEGYIKS